MYCSLIPITILVVASSPAFATDNGRDAFERNVAKTIIRRCLECHNATDVKGGLDLTRGDTLRKGGESGPAIVPLKPDKSRLIERVSDGSMPPKKSDRLSPAEIAALKTWIKNGANWPKGRRLSPFELSTRRRAGLDWWSLQPLRRPKVPRLTLPATGGDVKNPAGNLGHWVRNPIDAFILAKLRASGLQPAPQADRRTLIRRMTLILTGLPPTPETIRRFVQTSDPTSFERELENLLASPHYGERWARHWLDIARFAETNGFETNTPRPNAWRYRDYVIRAFNADKPYDRFVKEQLAGDALRADVATGFLVAGAYDTVKSPDVNLTLMQRQDELHDMINATSTAFLGLTVACARCHNHKFDPILQKDYYAFQAVLAGVKHGDRALRLADNATQRRQLAATTRQIEQLRSELRKLGLREPVNARRNEDRFAPVMAKFVRFTVLATNSSEPCLDELEIWSAEESPRNVALVKGAKATSSGDYRGNPKHRLAHINDGRYGNSRSWISNTPGKGWVRIELKTPTRIDRIVWGRDREERYKDRLAIGYCIEVATKPGEWRTMTSSADRMPFGVATGGLNSAATSSLTPKQRMRAGRLIDRLAKLERRIGALSKPAAAYAGTFEQPGATHRLHRGDPMQQREAVVPAAISSLGRGLHLKSNSAEQKRRLALANWIASPKNPLTARVMVNRIWQHHFGRGLVATPSDFGKMGVPPSHPELLDWLAAEFVRSGWSVKHIQRLIVQSSTWRQSSRPRTDAKRIDAGGKLLWRFPPRRMEAEAIRDSVLFVTGSLRTTMRGPGFSAFEPNTNYVRVYTPRKSWGPAQWRRMIYATKIRMEHDAVFGAFDCPDAGQATAKRARSTTPLQALNLLNSGFMLQQAELMATNLRRIAAKNRDEQIRRTFQRIFGRDPTSRERQAAARLVADYGLRSLCRALLNANEFLFLQ